MRHDRRRPPPPRFRCPSPPDAPVGRTRPEACLAASELDQRRKLSAIAPPVGVSTDSGWNCTPSMRSVRWRTPMTSPSSVRAVTTSSSGTLRRGERVVAADLDLLGQSREHALPVVVDHARLPVEERSRRADRAAEGLDDGLVTEADAERRHAGAERADELERDARVFRPSRARRDDEAVGCERLGLADRDRVVAEDVDLGAALLEEVDEVPRERVVVVEDQDPHAYSTSASSIAASSAASLARHSRCSASGSESTTTPAPACSRATPPETTIVRSAMHVSIEPSGRT